MSPDPRSEPHHSGDRPIGEVVIDMRLSLSLTAAFLILMGLAVLGTVNSAAVSGDGDLFPVTWVPMNLAGLGMVVLGAAIVPPRWKAEPQREGMEIDGVRAAALLFPYMRRPPITASAALTLFALAAIYALVLAAIMGEFSHVVSAAVFAIVLTWGAVASVRQLTSPKYVALTPGLLRFRGPNGRLDVPWRDIEMIGLGTAGFRFFCRIELFAGAPDPVRDRAMRKAYRKTGADFIDVTWLTCHPDRFFAEARRLHQRADSPADPHA